MNAWKQVLEMTMALALAGPVPLGQAQVPAANGGYGPVLWPEERQHELAGNFAGTLRNQACGNMAARLALDGAHHYTLTVRCTERPSPLRALRGNWWVDEIAGSCLILDKDDGEEKIFGFRISDDANLLSLDGGDCNAADERDAPHRLERTTHK